MVNVQQHMKRIASLVFILLCAQASVHAQGENNIWTFGDGAGLDFNFGNPVFASSNMYAN